MNERRAGHARRCFRRAARGVAGLGGMGLTLLAVALLGGPTVRPAHAAAAGSEGAHAAAFMALAMGDRAMLVHAAPLAAATRADDGEWDERRTDHVVLRYKPQAADAVGWYAEAAQAAYGEVAEIFGVERHELTIVLFPDEESYAQANPVAAGADGVLGHARPVANEIGLAVARLGGQPEAQRRDTLRHELTHVVLGELSDGLLPIGLQEGIAQYVERDPGGRERAAGELRRGIDAGQLLSLDDLNRAGPFAARARLTYPQSYALVAFLAERFGFDRVVALVRATRDAEGLDAAATRAFGGPLADLAPEWEAFLTGFVEGGYARNELDLWDMDGPRRQLAETRYAEARDGFERAARLYEGLGRARRLEQARDGARRATLGVEAVELSRKGLEALGGFEYERAAELLGQAEARWAGVPDDGQRATIGAAHERARLGVGAQAELGEARALLGGWRFREATERAEDAGRAFAALGDEAGREQADRLLADVRDARARLTTSAVGAGVVGLGAAVAGWLLRRRRWSAPRPRPQSAPAGARGGSRDAPARPRSG